jgi:hypothetical protein
LVNLYNLKYLIAFINSRALRFYKSTTLKTIHLNGELAGLSLPKINFGKAKEKSANGKKISGAIQRAYCYLISGEITT